MIEPSARASGSPKVLIIGCGFPQLGLLRAARELDLYVIGADANPAAIGAPVCHEFHRVSTHDVGALVELARGRAADGVTTAGSEVALRSTVEAAERLGMPFYADAATVERCQSKDLMRQAYLAGGAPIPAFEVARTLACAEAFARSQGLPVVVKPTRGWGQRGVSKVENPGELAGAYERARAASESGAVLVEEYVEGRELSVNTYTTGDVTLALSVTERVITHYPDPPGITFAEWYPSGLDRSSEALAVDAAIAGVRALGIVRGPAYTQLRLGAKGARLIETAHRLGGGLDPDVALLASGISLFRKILGVAIGDAGWERCGREKAPHAGAIGKFLIGRPGKVERVAGLEEARAMPGVIGAEVYVSPGATVHPLTDGSKRVGHVLAVGDDRTEAERNASRAASVIRVETA